ncbi:hypothetical protein AB0H37_14700 [Actinomadura sp. NPDC023710]|uniref:hypothetical protein n=1 Tax=Actinomadura sp. NPDC023710 TaxID=3158219 RepID=UPI0033F6882C
MSDKPTHPIPDVSALTERQLDGLACVACGTAFGAGSRSVAAGEALGAQVFACVTCAPACQNCGTVKYEYLPNENDRARLDCPRDHAFPTAEPLTEAGRRADEAARERADELPVTGTIPGEWPDGEPKTVREIERARRLIERHAALAAELRAVGADRAAQTMDAGCAAFERVIAALESGDGEAIDEALGDALVTMTRGQATLARYVVAVAAVE